MIPFDFGSWDYEPLEDEEQEDDPAILDLLLTDDNPAPHPEREEMTIEEMVEAWK